MLVARRTRRSGPSSSAAWSTATSHGVRLVVPDAHAGLKAAIGECSQGAGWQRCCVHAMRNLLAVAKAQHRTVVAVLIRTILAQPDPEGARTQLRNVVDQLEPIEPKSPPRLRPPRSTCLRTQRSLTPTGRTTPASDSIGN